MQLSIRPLDDRDHDAVIDLSLRAWAPVFASLEDLMKGSGVFHTLYPDWRVNQRDAVAAVCGSDAMRTWIAEEHDAVVGFVAVRFDHEQSIGEIHLLAVDPSYQRRGIGAALTTFALDRIEDAGMAVAMLETGGDPSHAPARRTYEQAGFTGLPFVRYFKKMSE